MSKQSPGDRIPNLAPWWITCHWWRWDSGALGIFVLEKGSGGLQSDGQYAHYQHLATCLVSYSNLPALGPNSPTHVKNESIIRRRWAPDDCGPVTTEPGNDCNDGEDHPHHLQRQTNRYYRLPEAEGLHSTDLSWVFLTLTLVLSSEYSVLGASDPSYRESVSASVIIIITLRSKHREGSNPGIDSLQV